MTDEVRALEREGFITKGGREPVLPAEGRSLWGIWSELDWMRGSGFSGPSAITFLEIESWSRLYNRKLTGWAVKMICLIDMVYRSTYSEVTATPKKK